MTERYVITGPPASGKTSLAHRLMARGWFVVPEAARMVIDELNSHGWGRIYRGSDPFQRMVENRDRRMEERDYPGDVVFLDRSLADNIAFRTALGKSVPQSLCRECEGRYDGVFYLDPVDEDGGDDNGARGDAPDYEVGVGEAVRRAYWRIGADVTTIPAMSMAERADEVLARAAGVDP